MNMTGQLYAVFTQHAVMHAYANLVASGLVLVLAAWGVVRTRQGRLLSMMKCGTKGEDLAGWYVAYGLCWCVVAFCVVDIVLLLPDLVYPEATAWLAYIDALAG